MSTHIPHIVVIGSINVDMVAHLPTLPKPGQTILGDQFYTNIGGKGANQAVAAARCGAQVTFLGCVGNDDFGRNALSILQENHINTQFIKVIDHCSTGVAGIFVDHSGHNMIGVIPGANGLLSPDDIRQHKDLIQSADIVLMQLEVPLETIQTTAKISYTGNARTILNPAPAFKLPSALLTHLDLITPNETEAQTLTGQIVTSTEEAKYASNLLVEQGCREVIITLGESGSYFHNVAQSQLITNFNVDAIDTTAAGDTFMGALSYALASHYPMLDAIRFANAAAAISVTRTGALQSAPYLQEIQSFLTEMDCAIQPKE